MKKIAALTVLVLLLSAPATFAADGFPVMVAGITLGDKIEKYAEGCNMLLASPMPDAPFMSEAHIKSDYIPGIRGGSLTYGNCGDVDKIVRIKLKFHDRSQKLFKKLLKKYTKKYGNPDSYEGDAFKNVISWRWNFFKGDQKASVVLMWSRKNEIRPGVSIKMSMDSMIASEYACYKKKFEAIQAGKGGPSKIQNLDEFIAR